MATWNPHTHGTPSWARFHQKHAPVDCAGVKDCPDCKTANAMIALVEKKDREVGIALAEQEAKALRQALDEVSGGQQPPPPPRKVYL